MKGVAPHPFEKGGDRAERIRARSIQAELLLGADPDEASLGKRSELKRDCPERDVGERSMNRSGRELTIPNEAEDFTPAWGRDRGEHGRRRHSLRGAAPRGPGL
jgi:hypothetical protein